MKPPRPCWITAACLAAVACSRTDPEPASVLPQDAGALVVFAPPERVRESLALLLERMPEAAGAVDLVRSVVGVCLDDDAGTRANGLDPSRGPAFALWEDAVLAILPLDNESLAIRRLRLRLAMFEGMSPAGNRPRKIHHFRQPQHPGVFPVGCQMLCLQTGPGGLQRGGGDTGGEHDPNIEGDAFG